MGDIVRETDVYYRLEVFTQTGTEGYNLLGLSRRQIINDVLLLAVLERAVVCIGHHLPTPTPASTTETDIGTNGGVGTGGTGDTGDAGDAGAEGKLEP